jgi:exopolysaccharide production protein ExoQ
MSTQLATLVCCIGILGLFYLDRDKSIQTSKALWIPVIWILIDGSRPVSMWLGSDTNTPSASQLVNGSPTDRLVLGILIAAGIIALLFRGSQVTTLLRKNWLLILYFSYCLLSLLWSDFPEVGFKRWIKAIGDLVVVCVVITDAQPVNALRRLITRTGFILLPASVLLIKYYGDLGRVYDRWSGEVSNCGVTYHKNLLGVLTFVLTLGALWLVLRTIRDKNEPNRLRHFIAQGTLLVFGVSLLIMAHSATSSICFTLGALLIFAAERFGQRPRAIHCFVLAILIVGGFTVFVASDSVAHAVGRQANLTGRTDIWESVLPLIPNRIVGAGFDSFWLGSRLDTMWRLYPSLYLNEAHNGYIEVYLNLGVVGVFLIVLLLFSAYRNAVNSFRYEEAFGPNSLLLAYIFTAAFYNITEAGFREMDVIWTFLVLAIVAANQLSKVPARNRTSEVEKPSALPPRWRQTLPSATSRHG